MGRRKFRLSTRKNYERKKYQTRRELLNESSESIVKIPHTVCSLDDDNTAQLLVHIPQAIYFDATTSDPKVLYERIHSSNVLPKEWILENLLDSRSMFIVSKVFLYGRLNISIGSNCSWSIHIDDTLLHLPNQSLLNFKNGQVNSVNVLLKLIKNVEESKLCIGNPDEKFAEINQKRKGQFFDHTGNTLVAYYDDRQLPSPTIRHSNCMLFIDSPSQRCLACDEYRSNLHSLVSRIKKQSSSASNPSSHVNYRFLTSPEKVTRLHSLRNENRILLQKVKRLESKLEKALEANSVTLDDDTSLDIQKIMDDEDQRVCDKYSEDSFQHIFWKQQKRALAREGNSKKGTRWHPLFIKWCLYLRHQSSKGYETLRESECISLPSQRTLRDYSNAVKAGAGFSMEVDRQLLQAAKLQSAPAYHSLVVLLIDEMHIKEDLVYDKHSGRLVGFVDLGNINNHLARFEESLSEDESTPSLANSMIAFMVKGLFTTLKFTYVQFPCTSLTGEQMFNPFWEAIFRLERIGFKVLATTFDGASVNRRLVALHDTSNSLVYKLRNLYAAEERYIYCFSDPPHLIKTVRNCWFSKNRLLWNNGKHISWQHLVDLYGRDHGKGSGLSIVPKLKYEHLHLTSFSKMRVDLAAQVLSESVSRALELTGGPEVNETSKFVLMFDRFFDALNVTNFTNWGRSRKPFQRPYFSKDDQRLKWMEETFLPYLDSWESTVNSRQGFTDAEKKRMLLSTETLLGIRRTVRSFVDFIKYIFTLDEVKSQKLSFLSNNLCQDPLECFFGCQRQRGGTSDNPSVDAFYNNTQALRVIDSFCRGPVKGNCRGTSKKRPSVDASDCTPLTKRKRSAHTTLSTSTK